MSEKRNPHNRGKCPFHVTAQDPLSAKSSIDHCVNCVKESKADLESITEDLRQIAFLTVMEETPKYNPDHPSGASFTTFIKARVCTRLWSERQKYWQQMPFPHQETGNDTADPQKNPLIENLVAEACAIENMADTVIQQLEIQILQKYLPKLLDKLTPKERSVIEMKFFEELNGVQIAERLDVSEGRVTQITQSALAKLGKAYISTLENMQGNAYQDR